MNTLTNLWNQVLRGITIIKFPTDILDILIVAFLVYQVLRLTRAKSSGQVVKAIIVLLVLNFASNLLGLNALNYVISKLLEVGLIALVVVFQPELRRLMERLGSSSIRGLLLPKTDAGDSERTLDAVVEASSAMANLKIGALIVFERKNDLEEYFKTGTVINADVSSELLKNIFFPKAALHDGAVVIRNDRIAAAGCVLPLTENPHLSRDLGTRHRAAIGITEHADAVVVVVSEETGVISAVVGGEMHRYLTPKSLKTFLQKELMEDTAVPVQHRLQTLLDWLKKEKDEDSHEE